MANVEHTFGYIAEYTPAPKEIPKQHNWICCGPGRVSSWEPKLGEEATLVIPVKPFRDLGNGMMDVHDDNGSCISVSKSILLKPLLNSKTEHIMKAMKDAVQAVAKNLLKANNTVTTLEIKTELRRDYPYYFWTQQTVSDYMSQLAGDGLFTYIDNGTYRIYSNVKPTRTFRGVPATLIGGFKGIFGPVGTITKKTPRNKKTTIIDKSIAIKMANDVRFESVSLRNGTVLQHYDIRAQKKTPVSYISRSKTIVSMVVGGKTYTIR